MISYPAAQDIMTEHGVSFKILLYKAALFIPVQENKVYIVLLTD